MQRTGQECQLLSVWGHLEAKKRTNAPGFDIEFVIKVLAEARAVAQRIVSEVEMGLLVRAASNRRDRILIEVDYGGGLRVSELVALTWADVISVTPARCS